MPTVVQDGEFTFAVHTRELPFEPPHVHVRFGGEEVRDRARGWHFHGPATRREASGDTGSIQA